MTSRIEARGATLPEAFAATSLAVIARAADPSQIEEREVREVRAHGSTVHALLANWINECLYVHDVEGFAWRRVEFAVFEAEPRAGAEPLRVHSFLHGETLDADPPGTGIVMVPAGSVSIRPSANGHEIALDV